MQPNDSRVERPLPKRWPRRTRAAILHALSQARVALTTTTDRVAGKARLL